MWSRVLQIVLRGRIQHRRVSGAAGWVLLIRLVEGGAAWGILQWFFVGITVPAWAVNLNFAVYWLANIALFFPQRRQTLTPALVWVDMLVNLLPMAAVAYWSGGIYSFLLPIFALKVGSYGLIYGVDAGVLSLATTTIATIALVLADQWGLSPARSVMYFPLAVEQRLTLAIGGVIFLTGMIGSFRFFQLLEDRETRLAEAAREMNRLYRESLQHQEHLRRLSHRMIQTSERTMQIVARELHDDLGQALTAAKMHLGLIDRDLPGDSPVHLHVQDARTQITALLQIVRHLSQLLRPAVLDDLGFVPAIQSYISRFGGRTGIAVDVESLTPETRFPQAIELALYRIVQEALTNVARHANAKHVRVEFHAGDQQVSLRIADDGRGFDAASVLANPSSLHGMGVIGMRERVATYGGCFAIHSRPGAGTAVELSISLTKPADEQPLSYDDDSRLVG